MVQLTATSALLTAALASSSAPLVSSAVPGRAANLAVSVAIDPAGTVAGDTVTAVITARNSGPDPASAVRITAIVPDGVTGLSATSPDGPCTVPAGTAVCAIPTLAAGATALMTITAGVPAATPAGTTATLAATVTSATHEADRADNTTTVSAALTTRADLGVTVTRSGIATVTNAGPSVARGILLAGAPALATTPAGRCLPASPDPRTSPSDPPASSLTPAFVGPPASSGSSRPLARCALPDLDPGDAAAVTIAAPPGSTMTNKAVAISAVTPDPVAADNIAAVRPAGTAVAGLGVSLTLSAISGYAGSTVPATLTVTNRGPSAATGVLVTSAGPAGARPATWTLPVVAARSSVVLVRKARVPADAVAGPDRFSATVVSPVADGNAADDTDTVPFAVLPGTR